MSKTKGVGKGWHGDREAHARAGRKGGLKVSENRQHMAEIGRLGGKTSGGNFAKCPDRAREAGSLGGVRRKKVVEDNCSERAI